MKIQYCEIRASFQKKKNYTKRVLLIKKNRVDLKHDLIIVTFWLNGKQAYKLYTYTLNAKHLMQLYCEFFLNYSIQRVNSLILIRQVLSKRQKSFKEKLSFDFFYFCFCQSCPAEGQLWQKLKGHLTYFSWRRRKFHIPDDSKALWFSRMTGAWM